MNQQGVDDLLKQIAHEWDQAEKLIKAAERVRAQVVMASVNELRYAGRRLVDAINVADAAKADAKAREQFERYIGETHMFCLRARHDAVDAVVLYVQKAVQKYEDEFGLALLGEKFPKIYEIRTTLAACDGLIVASREDRMRRVEEYATLERDHYPQLLTYYQELLSNRDVLVAMVTAKQHGVATDKNRHNEVLKITVIAALVSAIVAAVLTVAGTIIFDHRSEPSSATSAPATVTEQPASTGKTDSVHPAG